MTMDDFLISLMFAFVGVGIWIIVAFLCQWTNSLLRHLSHVAPDHLRKRW